MVQFRTRQNQIIHPGKVDAEKVPDSFRVERTGRKNRDLVRLGEMSCKQRGAALTAAEGGKMEVVEGDSHGDNQRAIMGGRSS